MTKSEILNKFQSEAADFTTLVADMDETKFSTQPNAEKWSVAQHLTHLVEVSANVAGALRDPSVLAQYGQADKTSRSYDEIVTAYEVGLAARKAAGKMPYRHLEVKGTKEELLASFASVNQKVVERVSVLKEEDLDTTLAPHPVLGLMILREMLYFITNHIRHHYNGVAAY